jgi:rhamnulokinase
VYLLTGKRFNEYTNASTTELIDVKTNSWSNEILDTFGIKKSIFKPLSMPGTKAGRLLPEISEEVGFDLDVVLAASHDTASAVMAVPSNDDNVMYISSGTWSLMGIESFTPQLADICMEHSFTNEGGYDYRYRVLKNIMGLWMIQNVKKELNDKYSFAELCEMASLNADFPSIVDAVDNRFLAPKNMTEEIKAYCRDTKQQIPETVGQLTAVIYNSLAKCYAECADEIEQFTGQKYSAINIIGGGSNADYLNRITAKTSGRTVLAGPSEATAIGNLMAQMLSVGTFNDLIDARNCVIKSFDIKIYD